MTLNEILKSFSEKLYSDQKQYFTNLDTSQEYSEHLKKLAEYKKTEFERLTKGLYEVIQTAKLTGLNAKLTGLKDRSIAHRDAEDIENWLLNQAENSDYNKLMPLAKNGEITREFLPAAVRYNQAVNTALNDFKVELWKLEDESNSCKKTLRSISNQHEVLRKSYHEAKHLINEVTQATRKCSDYIPHLYPKKSDIASLISSSRDPKTQRRSELAKSLSEQLDQQEKITENFKKEINNQLEKGSDLGDRNQIIAAISKDTNSFKMSTTTNCENILNREEIKSKVNNPIKRILNKILSLVAPGFKETKVAIGINNSLTNCGLFKTKQYNRADDVNKNSFTRAKV